VTAIVFILAILSMVWVNFNGLSVPSERIR
jgi:hypothetical protein